MAVQQSATSMFSVNLRARMATLVSSAILLVFLSVALTAPAQTLQVLHTFTEGADGGNPSAGITFDQQGRLYGTAVYGGSHSQGVVYRLVREGEGWVFAPIYSFGSQQHDGNEPFARVLFGPDGLLYGTTRIGGTKNEGTVFSLRPPPTACKAVLCQWIETVLYSFTGGADGRYPQYGDLAFDQAGNIYGTTSLGGSSGVGVVFKLTPSGSGWTESVLWNFTGANDGISPISGLIFDGTGNLYGTTNFGGQYGDGTVYELSPTQSGWTEMTLYSFNDNDGPGSGGLIWDGHGNLFGITGRGSHGEGNSVAYELTPENRTWAFTPLNSFGDLSLGPVATPTFDVHGNLYGPLPSGGSDQNGEIFMLTPSGNQWLYSPFYQFDSCTNGNGCDPYGAVTFDVIGNMYGTTGSGGSSGRGTVWEVTP